MTNKVAEIKKLEDGKIAVRWQGKRKFNIIQDDEIAQYLIYALAFGNEVVVNQNSAAR